MIDPVSTEPASVQTVGADLELPMNISILAARYE
jgi:hypothetical protein